MKQVFEKAWKDKSIWSYGNFNSSITKSIKQCQEKLTPNITIWTLILKENIGPLYRREIPVILQNFKC